MQRRFLAFVTTLAVFLILVATSFAQAPNADLYCTAGLQPDGYIDFSDLPKAPAFPNNTSSTSAPVTATLPVHGIAGLTVTVTIPALIGNNLPSPVYSVDGGSLTLNGLPGSSGNQAATVLSLAFSQAVYGVGLNASTFGRFEFNYTLTTVPQPFFSQFSATASGYTDNSDAPQTQSLQVVGLQTPFQGATVQFEGGEFYDLTLSNVRVRSVATPKATIPRNGLQQWLRADTYNYDSVWRDQSGNGHDATAVNFVPALAADGRNCQPALQFTGVSLAGIASAPSYLTFDLPIAGWEQMTIFLVASAARLGPPGSPDGEDAVIFWKPNTRNGTTFLSPFQQNAYVRFGTTAAGNTLTYARPGGGTGQDFTVTRAVHDGNTDSLYVDGLLAASRTGNLERLGGTDGAGTIGKGANNTYFHGEISEILIYNRLLQDNEAAQVEQYLARKYGIN